MTEHSAEILAGAWPSQSVMAWSGFSMAWSQAANGLFSQLDVQMDIKNSLGGMDGYLVDTLQQLARGRETTLQNRIEAYRHISKKAHLAASELQSTKQELADIVHTTEDNIKQLRDQAEVEKAVMPAAAPAIDAFVKACEQAAVAAAKTQAHARDLQGATTVTALSNDIAKWAEPYINSKMPETGGAPEMGSAPAAPAPPQLTPPANGMERGGTNVQPVDNKTFKDSPLDRQSKAAEQSNQSPQQQNQKNIQQTGMRTDDTAKEAATQQKPSNPSPMSSAPSSPASSGGGSSSGSSPASGIAHMMKPASAGSSSPGSSSPASSGAGGASNPANAAQSSQLGNAKPTPGGAVPGGANAAAAGAGAAGRAPGLASLGSGIAESSARLASGAVNTASNVASGAANVGSNVAQNVVSQAAGQVAPASSAAASTMPAAVTPGGGGPMTMMPAGGGPVGGPATVSPVTSTPGGTPAVGGGPAATPAGPGTPASSFGGATPQAAAGSQLAPIPLDQGHGVRSVGADGASGTELFSQAMAAGQDVISSMVAQTLGTGYIAIHYAVALVYERGGMVSAWMATSEGASYVPLGVRIPRDVRMSVNDPIVGHDLWERSATAGGANPLEVVVRQAEAREMSAPGGRVLAIASSLPMDQVMDWAGEVGARPVAVDPKSLAPITVPDLSMAHRCAVAMPWEWRQANAFGSFDRLQVAQRHMHMAASAGHLSSGAAEEVMDLFELQRPIDDKLWRDVERARFMSLIEYEMAIKSAGQGGAEPARVLASARAAEVVLCLRNHSTAEGCADLLYASRLAGAPLNPAAAVA